VIPPFRRRGLFYIAHMTTKHSVSPQTMDRSTLSVRKTRTGEASAQKTALVLDASQAVAMVWPITVDAWTMTGNFNAESRLQRHVVRIVRRER